MPENKSLGQIAYEGYFTTQNPNYEKRGIVTPYSEISHGERENWDDAASVVWDQAVAKCVEAINNLDPQTGDDVGSFRAGLNDSIAALRSLKRSGKTESDNGGCQANAGAKGETVSAPMEPLQSDNGE